MFCRDALSERQVEVSQEIRTKLSPYFDQVADKFTAQIIDGLATKVVVGKLDRESLSHASKKYYRALQGPRYKAIFRKFLYSKQSELVQHSHEFHQALEKILVQEMGVELTPTRSSELRALWSKSEVIRSWVISLSLQSAVNYVSYSTNGSFIFLPITIPKFQNLQFDKEPTKARNFSLYFHGVASALLNTYYAVTLAMFATDPAAHVQIQQMVEVVTGRAQSRAELESAQQLVQRSDDLLSKVDALVARTK